MKARADLGRQRNAVIDNWKKIEGYLEIVACEARDMKPLNNWTSLVQSYGEQYLTLTFEAHAMGTSKERKFKMYLKMPCRSSIIDTVF